MRKSFSAYYRLTDAEFTKLWSESRVVVDTNILLNFYRYSEATRNQFFDVLRKIGPRLWIPHRVALEFHINRIQVIRGQRKVYDDLVATLKKIIEQLKQPRSHPFISHDGLMRRVEELVNLVVLDLEKSAARLKQLLDDDTIMTAVTDLFDGRVGLPYSEEKRNEVAAEAGSRKQNKVPPGFKDENGGDYMVWSQILDRAAEESLPVLFVTDDRKEDWWHVLDGESLGPRVELREEFWERCKQLFYMYTPDRFLEYANKYLFTNVTDNAIEEARETKPAIPSEVLKLIDPVVFASDLPLSGHRAGPLEQLRGLTAADIERASRNLDALALPGELLRADEARARQERTQQAIMQLMESERTRDLLRVLSPLDLPGALPRDPLGALPRDPLGALPRDPLGALPRDPLGALPRDPLGALPRDPLGELPTDHSGSVTINPPGAWPRDRQPGTSGQPLSES